MSITTDSYIDVINAQSATVDRIGLSKTLDNYTIDELLNYCFCGADNNMIKYPVKRTNTPAYNSDIKIPFNVSWTGNPPMTLNQGDRSSYATIQGTYGRIVWLKGSYTINSLTSDTIAAYKLVTEFKAKKYCYILANPSKVSIGSSDYGTTNWNGSDMSVKPLWNNNGGYLFYYEDFTDDTSKIDVSSNDIYPYIILIIDDKPYIIPVTLKVCNYESNRNWNPVSISEPPTTGFIYPSFDKSDSFDIAYAAFQTWDSSFAQASYNFPYGYSSGGGGLYGWSTIIEGFAADKITGIGVVGGTNNHLYNGWKFSFYFTDFDDVLKFYAQSGLYFKADKIYKPIIQNGYVTGYTDVLDTVSDIDNWQGSTNHNIPPQPPAPVFPDDDNNDAISTVGAPFGTGLAHYYVSTVDSTVLSQISEAMSTWNIDTTKKDLYRNLISCKIVKPPAGVPASPDVFVIYGEKLQYNGADITINKVTGNPSITFGSYDIPRKFNDFRDYAPYSKAEIFIPYCGWTALPSHVIGRSVSVEYFTDIIAGTVKAIVYCGNNVVAEAAGVMAVDVPFAAENVGAKVAAATTGLLSYGQGALQASAGIGQAVVSKGRQGTKNIANGLSTVIGAYNQLAMTANENWTEINGKSGDGCCLAGISTIIIKITRPKYGNFTAPYYVPEDFPHTVGFIAMKKTTPAACTGLIICDNVDTSGISGATERERQLIKEYLESGIIVEHPE